MKANSMINSGIRRLGVSIIAVLGVLTIIGTGGDNGDVAIDTDGDGLSDADEINIYGTSAVLADTDGDGDGYSDGREITELGFDADANNYRFNPLLADLPKFELLPATVPKIVLNYTTEAGSAQSYTNSSGGGATTGSETSHTAGASITAEASTGFLGIPSFNVSVEANYSFTDLQRVENTSSWEDSETYEESNTIATSGGSLSIGLNLNNDGYIPYTIQNIIFAANQVKPGAALSLVTPVANLNLDATDTFPSTSLAPGHIISGLIFSNTELHIDDAKSLLKDSGSLNLSVVHTELLDETGTPLVFDIAEAQSRSAKIGIDYGFELPPEEYLVATIRDPNNPGETMADIFSILRLDVTVGTTPWATQPGENTFNGITRVRTVSNYYDTDTTGHGRWVVSHTVDSGFDKTTTVYDPLAVDYDPAVIDVKTGDVVLVLYLNDEDSDGLGIREERL